MRYKKFLDFKNIGANGITVFGSLWFHKKKANRVKVTGSSWVNKRKKTGLNPSVVHAFIKES